MNELSLILAVRTNTIYLNIQGIILEAYLRVSSWQQLSFIFFHPPSFGEGLLLIICNELRSLHVVQLDLRSNFPEALALLVSWSCIKPATGLCPPQMRHVCIFCCVTVHLVLLHSTLSVNSRIVTVTGHLTGCGHLAGGCYHGLYHGIKNKIGNPSIN